MTAAGGLLLIAAAGIKWLWGPEVVTPVAGTLLAAEAAAGVALLVGGAVRPRVAAGFGAAVFAGLAGVVAAKVAAGETSCGCFGGWSPSPAAMLALDAAVLFAFLCCLPVRRGWLPSAAVPAALIAPPFLLGVFGNAPLDAATTPAAAPFARTAARPITPASRPRTASAGIVHPVGGGTLTLDADRHDFGEAGPHDVLETRFRLTNTGGVPLTLGGPRGSCGCTVAHLPEDRRTLDPGDAVDLPVTLKPGGGKSEQTVTVPVEDPAAGERDTLLLTVAARRREGLRVDPTRLDFGEVVRGGDPVTRVVRLDPSDDVPLTVGNVTASGVPLTWAVEDGTAADGDPFTLLRVTLDPAALPADTPSGDGVGRFAVGNTAGTARTLELPVAFAVRPRVRLERPSVLLRDAVPGTATVDVPLLVDGDIPVRLSVLDADAGLTLQPTGDPPHAVRLTADVPAQLTDGRPWRATATLRADGPGWTERLPLTLLALPPRPGTADPPTAAATDTPGDTPGDTATP